MNAAIGESPRRGRSVGARALAVGVAGLVAGAMLTVNAYAHTPGAQENADNPAADAGSAVDAESAPQGGQSRSAEESADRLAEHWTEERKQRATAPKMPAPDPQQDSSAVLEDTLPPQSQPPVQPADAGSSSALELRSTPTQAEEFPLQGVPPAMATGKLYFDNHDGDPRDCTASVITSENEHTIWTAGHCLHSGGEDGDWYNNFHFVPDTKGGDAPHGEWFCDLEEGSFCKAGAPEGWTQNASLDHDLGALRLEQRLVLDGPQAVVGSHGYKFGAGQDFDNVYMLGYPWESEPEGRDDFTGLDLFYVINDTESAGWLDDRLETRHDMAGGASGSPWLHEVNPDTGEGAHIVGAHSHRDTLVGQSWVYSSNHGDAAINVYNAIEGN